MNNILHIKMLQIQEIQILEKKENLKRVLLIRGHSYRCFFYIKKRNIFIL